MAALHPRDSVERRKAVGAARAEAPALLVCQACERACGLPIELVIETMRPMPVQPLVGLPSFVLGVAVVRGQPTPVIDLAALVFGQPGRGAVGRFVTVTTGDRQVALAVEAVLSVQAGADAALLALPPLLSGLRAEVVEALGTLDADLLVVLRNARLVPEEVWRVLDQGLPRPEAEA